MSQENVELIRRTHDAVNRRELDSSEIHRIASELLHPDVAWHDQPELPGATVHHGVEGVERHLAAAREALDYDPAELLELINAGPRVVAVYRVHARGRASGVPVERDACYVYSFQGARIERVEIFGTKAEALKAAGLSEQAMSQENVEFVRRALAEFGGPVTGIYEAARAGLIAPDAELDFSAIYPDGPIIRGVEAWREYLDSLPWGPSSQVQAERFFDIDKERVLVFVHITAQGEGSGVPVENRIAYEVTIRDSAVVRWKVYADQTEALKAVGLWE